MSDDDKNNVQSIVGLIGDAVSEDEVSQEAADIMIGGLNDTNILGCTGVDVDNIDSDIVTVIAFALDSSYSMKHNEQAVREAYDELGIKAMQDSKQHKDMLISTRVFDDSERILYGFKKVDDVGKIGSQYIAEGSATAVYDTAISTMTAVRAYAKTLNDSGVQTKCIVAIFSDGDNNWGNVVDPAVVKKVAEDCLKSEMFYLVYIGFKNSPNDDLEAIGKSMGFPNVFTTTSSPSEIRKAMGLVSQSTIRKSQTTVGADNSFFS